MDPPLPNTYWVIPERILAGEHPSGARAEDTRRRLEILCAAGIDYFIDLTEIGEMPDYRPLLPKHVQYLRCAIRDTKVPHEVAHMQETAVAHRQRARPRPAYVYPLPRRNRTHQSRGRLLPGGGGSRRPASPRGAEPVMARL